MGPETSVWSPVAPVQPTSFLGEKVMEAIACLSAPDSSLVGLSYPPEGTLSRG